MGNEISSQSSSPSSRANSNDSSVPEMERYDRIDNDDGGIKRARSDPTLCHPIPKYEKEVSSDEDELSFNELRINECDLQEEELEGKITTLISDLKRKNDQKALKIVQEFIKTDEFFETDAATTAEEEDLIHYIVDALQEKNYKKAKKYMLKLQLYRCELENE